MPSKEMPKVGFLCYDLQPFTEDCLYRITEALSGVAKVKVFPVFYHKNQEKTRLAFLPSSERGRHFGIDKPGSTPEGLATNINWTTAWRCVSESDAIVLFGLQGGTALCTALLGSIRGRILISVNQTLPVDCEKKRRWWVRLLKQWLLNRCKIHVYQTPVSREVLSQVYGCQEKNLFFAPFEAGATWFSGHLNQYTGVDPDLRSSIGINTDEVLFLFVGNLVAFKGIPDLLEAFGTLPRQTDFRGVFAGPEETRSKNGGTISYFTDIARKHGIEQKIKFVGRLEPDELASLYHAADVVVLPTHRDTFGKVLVEGALAAKPLITTTASGAPGCIVFDQENGYVVEPGDVEALAKALEKLLSPELRLQMGQRSLELVKNFCSQEKETEGFVCAIIAALERRYYKKKIVR